MRLTWFPACPHREQRDPVYLKDKVTQRHSKEQFETAQKIEQEYSRYFTGRCRPPRAAGDRELGVAERIRSGTAHAFWGPVMPSPTL